MTDEQEGKTIDELAGKGEIAAPATEEEIMAPATFQDGIFGMRGDLEMIKSKVKNWMSHPEIVAAEISDVPLNRRAEMEVNLDIAYRHLESARMRLGKVIQAFDGGNSCYPK